MSDDKDKERLPKPEKFKSGEVSFGDLKFTPGPNEISGEEGDTNQVESLDGIKKAIENDVFENEEEGSSEQEDKSSN